MKRTQAGFTLIELMVVVAIVLILSAIMFGVNGKPYGGSPQTASDEIVGAMNAAKMRAVSSRRWHRVLVTPSAVTTYQWSSVGMTSPGTSPSYCGTTPCYQYVQNYALPTGITVWSAGTSACTASPCTGAPASASSSLSFTIDFKPDGSSTSTTGASTGTTLFVSDNVGTMKNRVVVYPATGTSYERSGW